MGPVKAPTGLVVGALISAAWGGPGPAGIPGLTEMLGSAMSGGMVIRPVRRRGRRVAWPVPSTGLRAGPAGRPARWRGGLHRAAAARRPSDQSCCRSRRAGHGRPARCWSCPAQGAAARPGRGAAAWPAVAAVAGPAGPVAWRAAFCRRRKAASTGSVSRATRMSRPSAISMVFSHGGIPADAEAVAALVTGCR